MAAELLFPARSLAYPAGVAPGFDPTHPASASINISAITIGGSAINLLSGAQGANSGTPSTFIDGRISLTTKYTGSTDVTAMTPFPATAFPAVTMAAIFVVDTVTVNPVRYLIADSAAGTTGVGLGINQAALAGGFVVVVAGVAKNSTFAAVVGVPYFVAVSFRSRDNINIVVTRLDTGSIVSEIITNAAATTAGDTTFWIGNRGTNSRQLNGKIAAVMQSATFLSLPLLQQWAADPWSFWYPHRDQFEVGSGVISTALLALLKSQSYLKAQPAGATTMLGRTRSITSEKSGLTGRTLLLSRSKSMTTVKDQPSYTAVLSAKIKAAASLKARVAAALALRGRATSMMFLKESPSILPGGGFMPFPLENKFAFPPTRRCGFDPSHPIFGSETYVGGIANDFLLSVVASSGGMISLLNGKPGTRDGTPAGSIRGIAGPAVSFLSSGDRITFPFSTRVWSLAGVASGFTVMAILNANAGSATRIIWSNNSSSSVSNLFLNSLLQLACGLNGGSSVFGPTLTAGRSYFVMVTAFGGAITIYAMDLRTGVVTSGSGNSNASVGTSNGFCVIGNRTANPFLGFIAALAVVPVSVDPALARVICSDPWSFWYPHVYDDFYTPGGSPPGVLSLLGRIVAAAHALATLAVTTAIHIRSAMQLLGSKPGVALTGRSTAPTLTGTKDSSGPTLSGKVEE